jgi:hypothetical protein
MTNKEAVERFSKAQDIRIEKMFWIAGSLENSELRDLMEEISDKALKKCFPEIANSQYLKEYVNDNELVQALCDFDKYGMVAEILIPICDSFSYDKNNKPVSWSSSAGSCRIDYVYSDTLEGLMIEIEKSGEEHFKEFLKSDKKKFSKLAEC